MNIKQAKEEIKHTVQAYPVSYTHLDVYKRQENTDRIIIEGLFTTITNVNFNDETLKEMIAKVKAEKNKIVPDCSACQNPCGNTDDYDMNNLWNDNEDIRSLKSLILFGIRGMAAYAYHARCV